jgi:hypothetical protein
MSTTSRITYVRPDGLVRSIYCHWDGYLEYNGQILSKYYNGSNLDKLMDLGDLSSLGKNPVSDPRGWEIPNQVGTEACVSYRDRGEDCPAKEFASIEDFSKDGPLDENFNYIFMDGIWYYWQGDWTDEFGVSQLKILATAIGEENNI